MDSIEKILGSSFDVVLAVMIAWLAISALGTKDAFSAVIRFVAMGLTVTLAWVRLQAPDVALAEAAVGAGLSGAVLLASLATMRRQATEPSVKEEER